MGKSPVHFAALCAAAALAVALSASHSAPTGVAPTPENASRIDAPFTLYIRTPHVAWGKPTPGGPVRAFVVPSVSEGRTLVELAERIDLQFDTVTIDDAWDVNTWTVGTDGNYEARNYELLYRYLKEDITKPTHYDVIVLPSLFGWNRLPEEARRAIRERVSAGAGLVLIHPTTGLPAPDDPKVTGPLNNFAPKREVSPGDELWQLSPLVGVLSDRIDPRGFREIRSDAVAPGQWKRVASHFITDNVPFDTFPSEWLKHYRYQLGPNSTALVAGPSGEPIVAVKPYGRGRIVALGYTNAGLSPSVDWKILGLRDDHWWEYFYSLVSRSILWAAGLEPSIRLKHLSTATGDRPTLSIEITNSGAATPAEIIVNTLDEWGTRQGELTKEISLSSGESRFEVALPSHLAAGRQTVDVILAAGGKHYDWGTATLEISRPDEIASLSTDREFYSSGDRARVHLERRTELPLRWSVEMLDNRGRLLAEASSPEADLVRAHDVTLHVRNYSTNMGWVRVTLLDASAKRKIDQRQVRVNFASTDREFGAYELILPWHGPPTYQPWWPALDEQFRKLGVTVVEKPERNFKLIAEPRVPGFGVYWHYRQKYLEQKDEYLETGDKRYLIRAPDLASDVWLYQLKETVAKGMARNVPYRPMAYYLADEPSLTAYGDPLDFSWSEATLRKFREWLKTQYSTLAALNREWESNFLTWNEVIPLTTPEAQAKDNFAGWMDHRTFMEQVFAHALEFAMNTVHEIDPGGRGSISGTQAPGPSNAVNWTKLDHIVDYLQPYSEDDQDELHRSTRPGLLLTGFTGYERHGRGLRWELWHRLFHGQIGASLFWQYTALNADLTLTEQGRDLAETIEEIRNEGLALLLRGAERENCGVAVHYSLLSVRGHWITDGHIEPHELSNGNKTSAHLKRFKENRTAWLQALEDAGYQYDFLATEQIEAGKLAGYRVLILPDSIALSDGEVAAIRKFVSDGGFLIADAETGLMDGHASWQPTGRLDDVLGVEQPRTRSAPNDISPARIRLDISGRDEELEILPATSQLQATTGRPEAAAANPVCLVSHTYGSGHAIYLNFWMKDYKRLRRSPAQAPRLTVLRELLSQAGVRRVAEVRTTHREPLACTELIAFRKGISKYLALLPEPDCAQDKGPVTFDMPRPQVVYDLRAHRMLGRTSHVSGTLVPGEPLLYALEPAPLGRLTIGVAGAGPKVAQIKAGDTVKLFIRLSGQPGSEVPESAAHFEVTNPLGKSLDYYAGNIPIVKGMAEHQTPLALNDERGTWRVTAREPFTHQTASTGFLIIR